jgi:hypothetical protein
MNRRMTNEAIRQALYAQPFEPFTIHMADGRSYEVKHPEMVLAPRGVRTIVLHQGGDRYSMVDLFLISSLDFDRRKSGRNGRRKAG